MTWSEIYKKEIIKKGGLLPFILNKEKRSAGALIKRLIIPSLNNPFPLSLYPLIPQ